MKRVAILAITALVISGCATKRYGRVQPLTGLERTQYTCKDIDLEIAKVEAFQQQISENAEFNAASALGILGDFGIGNSMERGSAEKSAVQRLGQLRDLKAERGCMAGYTQGAPQPTGHGVATAPASYQASDMRVQAGTPSGYCLNVPADYRGNGSVDRPAVTDAMPRCATLSAGK